MTDAPLPSRAAPVLGDRYRLTDRIGSGGTSVVWRAYDELLDRDVAVKLLNPGIDSRWWPALRREAKAVAQLASPHAAHMYDYGEWSRPDGRTTPYLVMEFVDGVPLTQRLADGQAMPWREAATIVAEICDALAAAHARGLVHRDIKPDNILLTVAGVKVIDFGIAAVEGTRDADDDGRLVGTPTYIAPERLAGVAVGAPADMYAVGVLLYRALAGRLPWEASGKTGLLHAHLFSAPLAFPPLPDDFPVDLAELCYACLDKDPNRRPTAVDVADRARAVLRTDTVPTRARRRWLPAAAIAAALLAAATITVIAVPSNHQAAPPSVPLSTAACTADFSINRDSGAAFTAILTVTNTAAINLHSPQVSFTFPGNQHLTGSATEMAVGQQGNVVTATATSMVRPHDAVILPIAATYRGSNPIPTQVNLDHRSCVTTITGAAYRPSPASTITPLVGPVGSAAPQPTPAPTTGTAVGPTPPPAGVTPTATTTAPITPPATSGHPTPTGEPTTNTPSPSPSCPRKTNPHGKCHKPKPNNAALTGR